MSLAVAGAPARIAGAKETVNPLARNLERRRKAGGMSIATLCNMARVDRSAYEKFLRGQTASLRRATLDRIDAALDGAGPAPARPLRPQAIAGFHSIVMTIIAAEMRVSGRAVLATDFSRQRPMCRDWLRAAQIRRLATYFLVVELDLSPAAVAEAIGVSKQAVGKAIANAEDERDSPRIERAIASVRARLIGDRD